MFAAKWAKRWGRVLPTIMVGALLVSACGDTNTNTTNPNTQGEATSTTTTDGMMTAGVVDTPSSQASQTAGTSASPTAGMMEGSPGATGTATAGMMEGTPGASMGEVMYPQGSANLTLWHGYTGAEAETLTKVMNQLKAESPQFNVTLLAVPFDQLKTKFTTETSTGGGPDMVIGPSDWVGELAQANLVAMVDDIAGVTEMKTGVIQTAVNVASYNDKMYGIPVSMKNVALYYNKDLVKQVPTNTDEMLTASTGLATGNVRYGLALNAGFFHAVGYNFAYGGKIFNDEKTVDLTTPGTIEWLNWMKKAASTQGVFAKAGADDDINNLFKTGQAAMVINGPWALGDYQKALGADKVGVAVAPGTPSGGKFAPFVGAELYYINASASDDKKLAAVQLVKYIMSPGIAQTFATEAGQISTSTSFDVSNNEALSAFVEQAKQGTPFPNIPAMNQVWTPAGDMITKVLDGKATAEDAAKEATDAINKAIAGGQ
jgi:arabinogalactan oligomer / maltooligosaccharide transport system substrate-binding protein